MRRYPELLERRELLAANLLSDINTQLVSSNPHDFHQVGDRVVFVSESLLGTELWSTDGTTDGTRILKDITPGRVGSAFQQFVPSQDFLFFTVMPRSLWRTDGTVAGTIQLDDGLILDQLGGILAEHQGTILFRSASSARGIWITDGTLEGTTQVDGVGIHDVGSTTIIGDQFFTLGDGFPRMPRRLLIDRAGNATDVNFDLRFGPLQIAPGVVLYKQRDNLRVTDDTEEGTFDLDLRRIASKQRRIAVLDRFVH